MTQYIHGTSPVEQQRLTTLNHLINQACLREMNLRGGERILDVGSGLMQFTRLMARTVTPRGSVVAIESDPRQTDEAKRQAHEAREESLVDLRSGDAYDFPLHADEWGIFDIVHTRFLLEHLQHPQRVVDQMVRAARPGGRIILADDDHDTLRLTPESPEFDRLWRAYMQTYVAAGCDPSIGRHLVTLLARAGARPARNTFLFFGTCAGNPTLPIIAANLLNILREARRAIMESGNISNGEAEKGLAAVERWSMLPDAALWYSICWAEGIRTT